MLRLSAVFLLVTILNIIPAFVPATWTVITFLSVVYNIPFVSISIVSAFAATLGRVILAKLSRTVLREHFLKERTKRNLESIEAYLSERTHVGYIFFLSYAFTPLPSNQLFIAYGLTSLKLRYLAIPFLIGRVTSYLFLTFIMNKIADVYPEQWSSGYGAYFIIVQLLSIGMCISSRKSTGKNYYRKKQ